MRHALTRRSLLSAAALALVIGALLLSSFEAVAARSRAANRWNHVPQGASRPTVASEPEWGPAGGSVDTIISLHETFGPKFTFNDVGPKGDSPGDYGVFRDQVVDPDTDEVLGTVDVQCIAAYADQCRGSIRLHGRGQITFDGITPLNHDPDWFAVTGGTNEFRGAGGVVRVSFPSFDYALLTVSLTADN
jgi:hypothetical protein